MEESWVRRMRDCDPIEAVASKGMTTGLALTAARKRGSWSDESERVEVQNRARAVSAWVEEAEERTERTIRVQSRRERYAKSSQLTSSEGRYPLESRSSNRPNQRLLKCIRRRVLDPANDGSLDLESREVERPSSRSDSKPFRLSEIQRDCSVRNSRKVERRDERPKTLDDGEIFSLRELPEEGRLSELETTRLDRGIEGGSKVEEEGLGGAVQVGWRTLDRGEERCEGRGGEGGVEGFGGCLGER